MKTTTIIVFGFLVMLCGSNNLHAFQPERMFPDDRFIVTAFSDLWQNVPQGMELRRIQRGINISALQDMPLGRTNFSIAAGLAFSSHNLYSDHRYVWLFEQDKFDFFPIHSQYSYDKNKLSLNYLEVPVQFRFRTRDLSRTFRVYAGIKAGWLMNAHTKYEGDEHFPTAGIILPYENRKVKIKEHRLKNLHEYRIGLTATIGYGALNFFMYYPLTDVFRENSAKDMRPVSVGVSFVVF